MPTIVHEASENLTTLVRIVGVAVGLFVVIVCSFLSSHRTDALSSRIRCSRSSHSAAIRSHL
jgi:hypothetical protein